MKCSVRSSFQTVFQGLVLLAVVLAIGGRAFAADPHETIDAQATGTSTQLGHSFGVKLIINEYSTDADRQVLVDAFKTGKNQGLTNALQKMRSMGRIAIPGTLGFDLAYIRTYPTPTGRKIVFVTNRQISLAEAWYSARTMDYTLTAGMIEINDQDKSKSNGKLYPAAQLVLNKQGEPTWNLNRNPWNLVGIIDWNDTQAK